MKDLFDFLSGSPWLSFFLAWLFVVLAKGIWIWTAKILIAWSPWHLPEDSIVERGE